jgi:hypothetical protein
VSRATSQVVVPVGLTAQLAVKGSVAGGRCAVVVRLRLHPGPAGNVLAAVRTSDGMVMAGLTLVRCGDASQEATSIASRVIM